MMNKRQNVWSWSYLKQYMQYKSCQLNKFTKGGDSFVHIYNSLWVVDVSKPSSTPNNFSLHNINYRKLCFIEKYTNNSETK